MCLKKDIRVFATKADQAQITNNWKGWGGGQGMNWINSFVGVSLDEFKVQYVDKNERKPNKGIINTDIREFEKKNPIRNINIISFRVLNYALYSYLLGSYILGNITDQQIDRVLNIRMERLEN